MAGLGRLDRRWGEASSSLAAVAEAISWAGGLRGIAGSRSIGLESRHGYSSAV